MDFLFLILFLIFFWKNKLGKSFLEYWVVCCSHQSDRRIEVCISQRPSHGIEAFLHQSEHQSTVPHISHVVELGSRYAIGMERERRVTNPKNGCEGDYSKRDTNAVYFSF